jgi:ketosteroid isomerase-like protein
MKIFLLMAGIILLLCVPIMAADNEQTKKPEMKDKVTERLLQLEKDFQDAIIKNDAEAISHLTADDWIIIDAEGGLIKKEEFLALIKSGTLKHTVMNLEEPRVRVYGEAAVVTGRATSGGTYMGNPFTTVERSSDVFVKMEDRWVCVLTQLTSLAAEKNNNK